MGHVRYSLSRKTQQTVHGDIFPDFVVTVTLLITSFTFQIDFISSEAKTLFPPPELPSSPPLHHSFPSLHNSVSPFLLPYLAQTSGRGRGSQTHPWWGYIPRCINLRHAPKASIAVLVAVSMHSQVYITGVAHTVFDTICFWRAWLLLNEINTGWRLQRYFFLFSP